MVKTEIVQTQPTSDPELNDIAGLNTSDGNFIVSDGSKWIVESGATARASLGAQVASSKLDNIISLGTTSARVFGIKAGESTVSLIEYGTVCFLKGTKITLPDKSQKKIEDLKLGDFVLTYKIDGLSALKKDDKIKIMNWSNKDMNGEFSKNRVKNIWVNPTEKYLVINDKLRITNLHIIHVFSIEYCIMCRSI